MSMMSDTGSNENSIQPSSTGTSKPASSQNNYNLKLVQEESYKSHRTAASSLPTVMKNTNCHAANPANLLNFYCADFRRRQQRFAKAPNSASLSRHHKAQHLDETFRVVDFLFGNPGRTDQCPTSASSSEGAIQILDQHFLKCPSVINRHDTYSNTTANTSTSYSKKRRDGSFIDTISRMESPVGRSVYLVSKGSKSGKKRCIENTNATKQDSSSHYLCLLSDEIQNSDTSLQSMPHMLFCSCRSFLERTRTTVSNGNGSCRCDSSVIWCKHLLAIKLLPVLGTELGVASEHTNNQYNIPTMDFASEEDFSRAIIQRLNK